MLYYVIQIVHQWKKKDGTEVKHTSYFQKHSGFPLPLNHLSGLDDCKKYQSRADALIDWRKYFGSKNKRSKVISVDLQPKTP